MNTVALSLAIKHGDVNAVKRILDVDPTIVNSQDYVWQNSSTFISSV
ncbi:hypothetical protein [Orientia tsutsugamushi]|uniref:Ankyrin repeat protein n=1 Tax=Orientia tsutsugamushi str. TA716 TaxID=1359175 RepID=A0A0F3PAQ6_ORITS|nr:hypothetical protein [Orientia tsutsugamushi]KJV77017.1 ankyrin repeat protein [Orientia tsutsugamushi str. TA716]